MAGLFSLLLIGFLLAFFGMESFIVNYLGYADVRVLGISLLSPGMQVFLGIGIIFCEFAIIMFAMLDHVGNTIKEVIKPLVKVIPLLAFGTATYRTFSPIAFNLMPQPVAQAMGGPTYNVSIAQAVSSGSFNEGILLTLATMLLFILAVAALKERSESPEGQKSKTQITNIKKILNN